MAFTINKKQGKARTGVLTTKTGNYKTPFFMPVSTKATPKILDLGELKETNTYATISNAFLLYLKPGLKVFKAHKGIHNFMKWNKCSFTDSGGFQSLSLKKYKNQKENFLTFKSPFDGSLHKLNPKKVMEIEQTIGADVAMAIDDMPLANYTSEQTKNATARTHKWAIECIKHHKDKTQLLFGICQGGTDPDFRAHSAKFIGNLPFDGCAIGGLAIGESIEKMNEAVKVATQNLPEEKPRYLMGVGTPKELIDYTELGVDIFDSVWPTRIARHGKIMTKDGYINMANSKFKESLEPLDKCCNCKICKSYTQSYLHHLLKQNEQTGLKFLSFHNIHFLQNLMKEIHEAIENNSYAKLKTKYKAYYK